MSKKLVFRIIGALASSLIIVGVFVPYIGVTGYSQSLFEGYMSINSLYLPIMILVFGVIGVLVFSLNKKTEFAYATSGAIIFFVVMQTIDIVNQDAFNTLSIGYYFLFSGGILTAIMAFLTNLKDKISDKPITVEVETNNESGLNKIDTLYNDELKQENITPMQSVDNFIQPIPVEPFENNSQNSVEINQPINPAVQNFNVTPTTLPEIKVPVNDESTTIQSINPVVQEFTSVQEVPVSNSIVQEFNENSISQNNNIQDVKVPKTNNEFNISNTSNPVVQQFTNSTSSPNIINQNTNINETDIFGQPINK